MDYKTKNFVFYIDKDGVIIHGNENALVFISPGENIHSVISSPSTTNLKLFIFSLFNNDDHPPYQLNRIKIHGSPEIYQLTGEIGKDIQTGRKVVRCSLFKEKKEPCNGNPTDEISKNILFQNKTVNLIINPDNGEILNGNKAAQDYYGYSFNELISKNIKDINILSKTAIKNEMLAAKSEKRNHFLFKHKHKNGTVRNVEVYSHPIFIHGKKLLFSIIFDIENKIQAEKKLRKLSAAVWESPISIIITSSKGKIEYVNPFFSSLTGYTEEEVRGKTLSILKSGKTPPSTYKSLWATIKSGKTWQGELINKKKDGSLYWENVKIAPIHNSNEEITHYVAIKEDITQSKRLTEKLEKTVSQLSYTNKELFKNNKIIEEERSQFISILNSIPENIYVADMENHEILFINEHLQKRIKPTLNKTKCYELIQGRDKLCDFCSNPIIAKQDKPYYWENLNPVLNRYFFIINKTIKWTNGKKVRFELAIDFTKQKLLEKEILTKNEKLRKLIATKDRFFSIIAHDLRGPLTSLVSYLDFTINNYESQSPEEIFNSIKILKNVGTRTVALLENLLLWSKSQKNEIKFNPQSRDIKTLIINNLSLYQNNIKHKKIKVIDLCPENMEITCDYNMINTVLRNLINNAIKFTSKGEIVIRGTQTESSATITVEDTGIGMDNKTLGELFQLDTKISPLPGTKGEKGSGLGLILCAEFIAKHKGEIKAESRLGEGSKFTFTIPLKS